MSSATPTALVADRAARRGGADGGEKSRAARRCGTPGCTLPNGHVGLCSATLIGESRKRRLPARLEEAAGVDEAAGAGGVAIAKPAQRRRSAVSEKAAPVQESREQRGYCLHGRRRSRCVECGGWSLCPHGRQRSKCKACGGIGICHHGRQRCKCKACGGSSICPHGRTRSQCKACGGSGLCQHGRRRDRCKECVDAAVVCVVQSLDLEECLDLL